MFDAIGVGARRKEDGNIVVKVRFVDTRKAQDKIMSEQDFTGMNFNAIKAQVESVLTKLKLAEDDSGLQREYVGVTIASI